MPGVSGSFPQLRGSAQRREQGLESNLVQVPAPLLMLKSHWSLLSSECRVHVCQPWSPPAHRPAVTLGDRRGFTELRKAEPQPNPTPLPL